MNCQTPKYQYYFCVKIIGMLLFHPRSAFIDAHFVVFVIVKTMKAYTTSYWLEVSSTFSQFWSHNQHSYLTLWSISLLRSVIQML